MRSSDDAIVKRCLEGDVNAFSLPVERYQSAVYGLCYHMVGNFADAQDLTQESFVKVYMTPTQLAFLAAGHEKDMPNAFEVNAFTIQNPTKRLRQNCFLRWSEDLDWAFVISVIMSFAAIVLVYDSISGERESGTLRLSISNPVPRSSDTAIGWAASHARREADQEYDASHPESADLLAGYWVPRGILGKHLYRNDAFMAVYRDYWDGMVLSARLGRNVTRISPCVVYRCAAESIAGSGIDHYESFMKQIWQYKTLLRNFLVNHNPLDLHRQYDATQELERQAFRAFSRVKFTGADVPKFHDDPIPAGDGIT